MLRRSLLPYGFLAAGPPHGRRAACGSRPYRPLTCARSGHPDCCAFRLAAISGVDRCMARAVTGVWPTARPLWIDGLETTGFPFVTVYAGPYKRVLYSPAGESTVFSSNDIRTLLYFFSFVLIAAGGVNGQTTDYVDDDKASRTGQENGKCRVEWGPRKQQMGTVR